MRKIVNVIFYIGFLFFGGGFLIALGQFVLYNGVGNFFEYVKADNAKISLETTYSNKIELTNIYYSYTVDGKLFESEESRTSLSIEEKGINIDEIYYNKRFPSLSYVGNNELSTRRATTGMVIMGFFFMFLFLIFKFADVDKWIGVYTRGEYKSSRK